MRNLLVLLLFVPSLCLAQVPTSVPMDGLVSWYGFNADAQDSGPNSLNGTLHGSPEFVADRFGNAGQALQLSNNSQYVSLSNWFASTPNQTEWTMSIWFKRSPESSTYPDFLIGHRGHFRDKYINGGAYTLSGQSRINNTTNLSTSYAPESFEDTWHSIVLRSTLDSLQLYFDGTQVSGTERQGSTDDWTTNYHGTFIGGNGHDPGWAGTFEGLVDDAGVWSRALDPDEISFLVLGAEAVHGCTDQTACNFHPEANVDDGSCTYLPAPIELGADIYTCDSTVQLEAGGGFEAYLWSNGETTSSIEVTEIGDYAVEATLGSANQRAVQLHAPTILESGTDPLINGIFAGLHPFSVSLWVRSDQLGGVELCDKGYSNSASGPNASSMQLFSRTDGLSFQLFTDANHWMGLSTSPATGLLEGEWNHVVCTYDGGTTSDALRVYVNGADLDTISTPIQQGTFSGLHANTEPLHFGGRISASGVNAHPLDGLLDDIFVFDHALSASQVEQLLTCGICWTPTCHWDFEETDAAIGDLINGTFASSGTCSASLYSPSFPGNALLSPSAEVRPIQPQCLFTDSISVTLVPCTDLPSLCGEGTMWSTELNQCVEILEVCTPSCGEGTVWDPVNEECIIAIPTDTDFDGCVTAGDVLNLLATFGTCPPLPEWPDESTDTTWACGDLLTYWDYDYATVLIGDQCWFAENLRTAVYANGDAIPSGLDGIDWTTTTEGANAIYGEGASTCTNESPSFDACDEVESYVNYGRLYNWYAVDDARGLCPSGWHIPSDQEWVSFEMALGIGEEEANSLGEHGTNQGIQLKATSGWNNNGNGTDELNFSGRPAGNRLDVSGHFVNAGQATYFWSSTLNEDNAFSRLLVSEYDGIVRTLNGTKNDGFSVRCLKD